MTHNTDQVEHRETTEVSAIALDPTSFTPYGQLLRMLVPRALNIAIHNDRGQMLWSADGCESVEFQQLAEDELARLQLESLTDHADWCTGRQTNLDGDVAYAFMLRDTEQRPKGIVLVAYTERDAATRSLDNLLTLLRPALEVLLRELVAQSCIDDLQRDLRLRDTDMALLLNDEHGAPEQLQEVDDFGRLVRLCLRHLHCDTGVLLVPEKNVAVYRLSERMTPNAGSDLLNKTHRHLFAVSQVQRRTFVLNRSLDAGPLARLGHKILACPILHGGQRVIGVLAFFRPLNEADFVVREIRLVELLARRVAQILAQSYDGGTGLLTRQALDRRVMQAMRSPQTSPDHHVIYVDIDRLHVINDTYGMHVGDAVITRIAEIIRGLTNNKIAAAKISGDRFALFLQAADTFLATKVAEQLCAAIHHMGYTVGSRVLEVSASFGVAPVLASEHPLSHALAGAEAACKAAKDRGRNRVEVFADSDQSIIRRFSDVGMLATIRDALDHDHFQLYAQPVVELQAHTGVKRYELLLRMQGEKGELLAPDKFLLAAERYQLAPAIDRWVLSYVLEVMSALVARLPHVQVRFAVNLSGQSLSDDEFLDFIENQLRAHRALAPLISFELTETAAVSNIVRAESLMRRLRELGHEIALDDFGKGLSSLSYLKSLPVSCVKLDGDLIRDLAVNQRSQAMVSAVVQLARAMKLTTTAECIENDSIRAIVAELGVDYAQGYAVGRPRPLAEVLGELSAAAQVAATA